MLLHTETHGSGPRTVALVHGIGGSAQTWGPLIDRWIPSGRVTVTAVDLRGHGESGRAESYGLEEMADDLVETLPRSLDCIVGHSLGGAVLVRAVERLAPSRAVYLDPGFAMAVPTTGLAGRLFWLAPLVTLGGAQLLRLRKTSLARAGYDERTRGLIKRAGRQFDRSMAIDVFRDVAFHPIEPGPPDVPSTLVLSDDSPAVVPETMVRQLEPAGWDVRRIAGVHHDMHLEDPHRTMAVIDDLLR